MAKSVVSIDTQMSSKSTKKTGRATPARNVSPVRRSTRRSTPARNSTSTPSLAANTVNGQFAGEDAISAEPGSRSRDRSHVQAKSTSYGTTRQEKAEGADVVNENLELGMLSGIVEEEDGDDESMLTLANW